MLDDARAAYDRSAADARVARNAPVELQRAQEALQRAQAAHASRDDVAAEHHAYLARRFVDTAVESGRIAAADEAIADAGAQRQRILLELRTREAEEQGLRAQTSLAQAAAARRTAEEQRAQAEASQKQAEEMRARAQAAQRQAQEMQAQAEAAQRLAQEQRAQAEAAQRLLQEQRAQAEAAQRLLQEQRAQAEAVQRQLQEQREQAEATQRQLQEQREQAEAAQRQVQEQIAAAEAARAAALAAEERASKLDAQLAEMKAVKTERGMVLTLGDVLFDSGRADIKGGAQRTLQQLARFLKENGRRTVVIEGHTDAVGSSQHNLTLSEQRALEVKKALVALGVAADRITARGFGETRPLVGNDTPAGRQHNRRVEIILPR